MGDFEEIVLEGATRLFTEELQDEVLRESRRGGLSRPAWGKISEAGYPRSLLGEQAGGFGLAPADALELVRVGGRFASPVPLGESMLANHLLTAAGLAESDGPTTVAILPPQTALHREAAGWRVVGTVRGVPWARHTDVIAVQAGDRIARVPTSLVHLTPEPSMSGLPRDSLHLDLTLPDSQVAALPAGTDGWTAGAIVRVMEIAGALESVLDMTVTYASERVQFGKPIGSQQAIQHQLAILAAQTTAAAAAADLASAAFGSPDAVPAVAAAKSRAGEAAGIAVSIAHQVHGALGFASEHRLHLFTNGLRDWLDEFGSERYWSMRLGDAALARGAAGYWSFITAVAPTRN